MEFRPTSVESLTEATDAANSSAPSSSANSSVSNVSVEPIALTNSLDSARALFRERSQLVNYIKAGIEEGKRQARKYIRKALTFGVRSGYLIPTDPRGNVLRVCPTLADTKTADAESRRKRRVARRGETRLTTTDDRKAMRRGIPRSRQDTTAKTATSKKGGKRRSVESPAGSLSTRESSTRKSPRRSTPRERNKSKTVGRRKKIDRMTNDKRSKRRKRDDGGAKSYVKRPTKRRRMALFPKHAENNHEPVEECYENASSRDPDRCESNEDNYRAITERRKSTSRREDGSRMEKRKSEMNVDDDRDAERANDDNDNDNKDDDDNDDDDDEKSEEASVEHDADGTTGETNA